jgi:hypothetical protein
VALEILVRAPVRIPAGAHQDRFSPEVMALFASRSRGSSDRSLPLA